MASFEGYPIVQGFGPTNVAGEPREFGVPHFHEGLDIAMPNGMSLFTEVTGKVVESDFNAYGNRVVIESKNSAGTDYYQTFNHLSERDKNVGDIVSPGALIGKVGSTHGPGGFSTGPHLHYEVISTIPSPYPTSGGFAPGIPKQGTYFQDPNSVPGAMGAFTTMANPLQKLGAGITDPIASTTNQAIDTVPAAIGAIGDTFKTSVIWFGLVLIGLAVLIGGFFALKGSN